MPAGGIYQRKWVLKPECLMSPTTVLSIQEGYCFEYSTLLVSFLIGSGYDAYVVSGYATREFCKNDQSMVDCPHLLKELKVIGYTRTITITNCVKRII
uniref:Transglutaminase-like domain-containing protein n=1 Tax=Timema tahoe TaxID=61484 RepID=A0A7R9IET3_9NEOP|nr:unnamed protein product [Timema tahoe]